jgi:hypothetical protein
MALQMSNYLSGRLANVIFYERSGSFFARSMPVKVRQSASTKMRSKNFGIASSTGSALRSLLLPVLPFPKDRVMQNRFAGAIARWLQLSNVEGLQPASNLPFVNGFNFNDQTGMAERCKIPMSVTQPAANLMEVQLPAFVPAASMNAPANTAMIAFTITAASCMLKDAAASGSFTSTIHIPYNDVLINEQVLSLPVPTAAGAFVITAASLSYILADGKRNENRAFMPATVVDARYC